MTRYILAVLGLLMAGLAAIALARERPPWDPANPLQPLHETLHAPGQINPAPLQRCEAVVSSKPAVDIDRAQTRIRAAARAGNAELRREIEDFDFVLHCALARNPTDGRLLALMSWTAWRLGQPLGQVSKLLEASYRVHPYEVNTAAVRQLVIAANWARLAEPLQQIGRADQALRFAVHLPHHVIPELAKLYAEAGTNSDLYHEALDRIALEAPQLLADFEDTVTATLPTKAAGP